MVCETLSERTLDILRDAIEGLDVQHQIQIHKILQKHEVTLTKTNSNFLYDITSISKETYDELKSFVTAIQLAKNTELQRLAKENKVKRQYSFN